MAVGAGGCPSPEELRGLVGEKLAEGDRTAVEAHIETCPGCQEQLERLLAASGEPVPPLSASGSEKMPIVGATAVFLDHLRMRPVPLPELGHLRRDASEDPLPSDLGPYEILGRLGEGGMGTVYRARHRELDRVVALKVLPANRVDEAAVARFRNEMKAAGRLDHPNIVTARDAGRAGSTYFLAMDFVDGADLSALVGHLGPLPVPDACELIRQASVGLQHACDCGLTHRDVKPSNLMLARGGVVKVLDLGLARSMGDLPSAERLTATGMLLGTADYIAPEQIDRAHTADARADVYGLGGTLYFLLTGSAPFGDRRTWWEKLRAHTDAAVPSVRDRRPEVPPGLADLLRRMLAKDPADRPSTPGEVAAALVPFATGADPARLLARMGHSVRAVHAAPVTPPAADARTSRHGMALRYLLAVGVGALATLLALAPFLGAGRDPAREQPALNSSGPSPSMEGGAKEAEGVRLTYGPHGPIRPDHKVLPGEEVHMEFTHGVDLDTKGEVDVTVAGELHNQAGEKVRELLPVPIRGRPYGGGPAISSWLSFELADDQFPGEYKIRARMTDKLTGRTVNFEHPVYVMRPEFGVVRLRLSHDKEGKWPAGGQLTIGQEFFVRGRVVNFVRDGERVHLSARISARDPNGAEATPVPIPLILLNQKLEEGSKIDFDTPLRTIMAGEVTIVVEMEDLIAGKKAKYELPVVIHPLRSSSLGTDR